MRATRALLVPLTALALLLAGCGGGDTEPDEEVAVETEQDPDADSPETAEDDTDKDLGKSGSPAEPTADPVAVPSSSGAGCLEGTWLTDPDSLVDIAIASSGLGDFAPQVTVTGDALVTFSDGTVRTEYLDQVAELAVAVDGQMIVSTSRSDGVLISSYTATDSELTTSNVDASGVTMRTTTSINGEEVDVGDVDAFALSAMELGGTSTYTCTADELRMTPVAPGVDTSALTTVLHRQ